MTYRSELVAFRGRYDAARARLDEARSRMREDLELVETLRGQLRRRKLAAPDIPDVGEERTFGPAPEAAKAVELARLAEEAENEADRVGSLNDVLAQLASLLNRILAGEDVVMPLGEPPRSVPLSYVLAEAAHNWVLAALAAGTALVAAGPLTESVVSTLSGLALASGALAVGSLKSWKRHRFLAQCRQATSPKVVTSGSDGSEMTNWPLRASKGWDVSITSYSGNGRRDEVMFLAHDGRTGKLAVTGRGYEGGVILYDPATLAAVDVKQLSSCPHPDAHGRWSGSVPRGAGLRLALGALLVAAFAAATSWAAISGFPLIAAL